VAVILDVFNLVLFIALLICVTTAPVSDFRHAACHSAFPKAGGAGCGRVSNSGFFVLPTDIVQRSSCGFSLHR
jgi:hypothetical protein